MRNENFRQILVTCSGQGLQAPIQIWTGFNNSLALYRVPRLPRGSWGFTVILTLEPTEVVMENE